MMKIKKQSIGGFWGDYLVTVILFGGLFYLGENGYPEAGMICRVLTWLMAFAAFIVLGLPCERRTVFLGHWWMRAVNWIWILAKFFAFVIFGYFWTACAVLFTTFCMLIYTEQNRKWREEEEAKQGALLRAALAGTEHSN